MFDKGIVWSLLLAGALGVGVTSPALADPCPGASQVSIGVDISRADTLVYTYYCRGWGQSFIADDTLVHSITVWLGPDNPLGYRRANLFITDAENKALYAGPLVKPVVYADDTTDFRFDFDPPFSLPYRGKFYFVVQADYGTVLPLLASTADPYPEGEGWEYGPVYDCSIPAHRRSTRDHPDLVFEIVFCSDVTTIIQPGSWGKLKVIYR